MNYIKLAACGLLLSQGLGCGDEEAQPSLPVGLLVPQTGQFQFLEQQISGAVDVARNEINAAGGVLGQNIRVELGDDTSGSDADEVASEVARLASLGVEASLVSSSGGALAAVAASSTTPMLLMSGSSVSPSLTGADTGDLFFRTVSSVAGLPAATAAHIDDEGVTSIIIIRKSPDPVYDAQLPPTVAALESLGVTVVANLTYDHNDTTPVDPTPLLQEVYDEQPDAVYFGSYGPDGILLLQSLDRGQFTGRLFAGSGFQTTEISENVGAAKIESLEVITTVPPTGPGFERFRTAFMDTNGRDVDSFTIIPSATYDAMAVLALAIEAAGSYETSAVRDQLRAVSGPQGMEIEQGEIGQGLDLIRMGMEVNYVGMASTTDFDANGDVPQQYGLFEYTAGNLVFVEALGGV